MNVKGRCPACNNTTLFVGDGGWLTCSAFGCSDPGAAGKALSDHGRGGFGDLVSVLWLWHVKQKESV